MMQVTEGTFLLSCVKLSEDGEALIVRAYDVSGVDQTVSLRFVRPVRDAVYTDLLERSRQGDKPRVEGEAVSFALRAYAMETVRISF